MRFAGVLICELTLYITSLKPIIVSKFDATAYDGDLFSVKLDGIRGVKEEKFLGVPPTDVQM